MPGDQEQYMVLVNRVRAARGLAPLSSVIPVDDPGYFNRQMTRQLSEEDECGRTSKATV